MVKDIKRKGNGSRTLKGMFKPKYPEKYKGNSSRIVYRSSWELKCMEWFDRSPHILEWQSEEKAVAYRSPKDNGIHRYYPDFIIRYRNKEGNIVVRMIEVKPKHQTEPPKKKPKTQKDLEEVLRYGINAAKWEAAKSYCKQRGWEFVILTEDHLFGGINTSKK